MLYASAALHLIVFNELSLYKVDSEASVDGQTSAVARCMYRVYSRHVAGGGEFPPGNSASPRKSARANFQSRSKMSKNLAFHGCCCDWRSIIRS